MSRLQRGYEWLRAGVMLLAIAGLAYLAWGMTTGLMRTQPMGIDFLPMWGGAREAFLRPSRVYDFAGLTYYVKPLLAQFHGIRPFVYPPTALVLFAPFAFIPFEMANAIWTSLTLVFLVWVMAGQIKQGRILLLVAMVLTPASVLVIITGQVTYLIAGVTVLGLASMKSHPWAAGFLMGLAASVKPQALILLPVALVAIGQWRALLAAGVAASAAMLASTAAFGTEAWLGWLGAVPRFERLVMHAPALERGMITPTSLGIWLRVAPEALKIWSLAFGAFAVAVVWMVFRSTEDLARRLAALLGGGLFITPYAMHYDGALLAPAAVLLLARSQRPGAWIYALGCGALLCLAAQPHWGAVAVTAFVPLVALGGESRAPNAIWDAIVAPVVMWPFRRQPAA